jgi:hypothetical protein
MAEIKQIDLKNCSKMFFRRVKHSRTKLFTSFIVDNKEYIVAAPLNLKHHLLSNDEYLKECKDNNFNLFEGTFKKEGFY